MRISLFSALLLFLLPFSASAEWQVRVVAVVDGDTLVVSDHGRAHIIRLFGIDCPEKTQDFGLQAKTFTSHLVSGKEIRVIVVDEGRYSACKVYVGHKSLNEEILKAGFAWYDKRFAFNQKWSNLEQQAKALRKGLWSKKDPVSPWAFRGDADKRALRQSHTIKLGGKHGSGSVEPTGRHQRPPTTGKGGGEG